MDVLLNILDVKREGSYYNTMERENKYINNFNFHEGVSNLFSIYLELGNIFIGMFKDLVKIQLERIF